MLTNKKIIGTVAATLVTTSFVFAQGMQGGGQGEGRPQDGGGFFQRILGEMRGERKDDRQEMRGEFKDDKMEARQDFKEGMMERRDYMMGSSTPGSATPTPWKDFRKDMKDIRGEMKDKMNSMMPRMASVTDAQVVAISAKLGVTVESIKAQMASGKSLREIIGNKITREEMETIIPRPMMASGTNATGSMTREERRDENRRNPQGFFNSLRMKLFGGDENNNDQDQGGAMVNASGSMQVETQVDDRPGRGVREFFKKFFNF